MYLDQCLTKIIENWKKGEESRPAMVFDSAEEI
jgi:hypothetical protein